MSGPTTLPNVPAVLQTTNCGLTPYSPCESRRVSLCPLEKLAEVAASLHPSPFNNFKNNNNNSNNKCIDIVTVIDSPSKLTSKPVVMIPIRFALQKPHNALQWGMTLSMIHANFLIVGYVDHTLMNRYTAIASYETHDSFLQDLYGSVRSLRPGDIILAINGRPIASFSSFLEITLFLKHTSYLWMNAIRNPDLSKNITYNNQPQLSYWAAEETYRTLKPQLLQLALQASHHPGYTYRSLEREDSSFGIRKFTSYSQQPPATPPAPKPTALMPVMCTNPLFRDDSGKPLPYSDDLEYDPDDGSRAKDFLVNVDCFSAWLALRKAKWRQRWTARELDNVVDNVEEEDSPTNVPHDFWSHQGFSSFEQWQQCRTAGWKRLYSWNLRKRKRIEEDAEEIVHFPCAHVGNDTALLDWLRVRKNQWKILRRKHQRKLEQTRYDTTPGRTLCEANGCPSPANHETSATSSNPLLRQQTTGDMLLIDSLLEEQECKRQANLKTYDFAFVFDAKLGAPDDVIAQCLRYLPTFEHGKLLCINSTTSSAFKERDDMWRQLCPTHWILPRRPRKRWHDLYLTKIRQEADASRKQSDDLMANIASVLFKGDHFQKIEKLVTEGEEKFGFHVNHVSGVVCERNSILNLAVIHGRYKVVRWLVETKGSDVESCDRGGFTPLLNAAWAGNIRLVRFLMSCGCDRTKLGRGHYTKPLAAPDFQGYTAEGWARERSHPEVAELLRVGL